MTLIDSLNEILKKEETWTKLINENLLNIVYCNLELRPFYLKKLQELNEQYNSVYDVEFKKIIRILIGFVEQIIKKLDSLNEQYKNLNIVDIKSLVPSFILSRSKSNDIYSLENAQDDYLYEESNKVI